MTAYFTFSIIALHILAVACCGGFVRHVLTSKAVYWFDWAAGIFVILVTIGSIGFLLKL